MADPNMDMAPQGTTDPTGGQPQSGPATDNLQGTTETPEQKAQREAFYQTKYQGAVEQIGQMELSNQELLQELEDYKRQYGPLTDYAAPAPSPAPYAGQPEPEPQLPDGLDPYANPAAYVEYVRRETQRAVRDTVAAASREAVLAAQQEAANRARVQAAYRGFNNWATKHNIGQDLIGEASREYASRFGSPNGQLAGTPEAMVEWVSDYIIKKTKSRHVDQFAADKAREAAEKAKLLSGVAQPAPGQAPSPITGQPKSWGEQWADKIAPPDPEPRFD